MFSTDRPSPYGRRPHEGYNRQPERPFVKEDTIKTMDLQIERKVFILTLKENPRGRFLRITEDAGGKRNTIIVPITGMEDFRRIITEMAAASESIPAPKTDHTEEPGDDIGNR